jgi:prophage antirepressor-like protein
MSDSNITPFQFENQAVRTVSVSGEIWFVAKDVIEAVDAVWGARAISHIPGEWKGMHPIPTPGGTQEMAILSEHGVYFYLNRSDKPKALPIQMWIAGEVLPSIRKTGGYNIKQPTNFDAIRALVDAAEEHENRIRKVEAAIENFGAHEDYRSIKAHAALTGRRLTTKESADLGRLATSLSRQRKLRIGTQPDATYGHVNLYHRDLLEEIFNMRA